MYTTIRGIYDNGKIVLYEQPPTSSPTKVLITFTTAASVNPEKKQRNVGFAKDYIVYVAPDFDAPLDDLKDYM